MPRGRPSDLLRDRLDAHRRRLELYEKCPRRFFYTHVLGLGGARKATAFARTHDCLYELIRWLSQARLDGRPRRSRRRGGLRSHLAGPRAQGPRLCRRTTGGSPHAWSARWCVPAPGAASGIRAARDRLPERPRRGRTQRDRRNARRHGRPAPRANRLPNATTSMTGSNTRSISSQARRISATASWSRPASDRRDVWSSSRSRDGRSATGATRREAMLSGHQRREVSDRDRRRHLSALPAFLHLPGDAEGAARPFMKKSCCRLSGYPRSFPITS